MMPDDDWALGQNLVDVRNEERVARLQVPACDRCTLGVMDATNSHYLGLCGCECHGAVLGFCPHGVDLDRAFCQEGCRI